MPDVVQPVLPPQFRPKLHRGYAVVGICLIRLEHMRPSGLPGALGTSSENAAHRIAVEWDGGEGVYIPRRDTNSLFNQLIGGRLFPGEHHAAEFDIRDENGEVSLSMRSTDGDVSIKVAGRESEFLSERSIFGSLEEASAFFENGDLGYSRTSDPHRLDALLLRTKRWETRPFDVTEVYSSFFEEGFPPGSVNFDHALVMRDIPHRWERAGR